MSSASALYVHLVLASQLHLPGAAGELELLPSTLEPSLACFTFLLSESDLSFSKDLSAATES